MLLGLLGLLRVRRGPGAAELLVLVFVPERQQRPEGLVGGDELLVDPQNTGVLRHRISDEDEAECFADDVSEGCGVGVEDVQHVLHEVDAERGVDLDVGAALVHQVDREVRDERALEIQLTDQPLEVAELLQVVLDDLARGQFAGVLGHNDPLSSPAAGCPGRTDEPRLVRTSYSHIVNNESLHVVRTNYQSALQLCFAAYKVTKRRTYYYINSDLYVYYITYMKLYQIFWYG